MKKSIKIAFLFFFISFNHIYGQKPEIKIRQSFESAETKGEPALVTYTNPKNGSESFLVDAALGLSLPVNYQQTITGFFEYHRNTLTDEVSNTIQAGAAYELYTNKNYLSGDNRRINGSTTLLNLTAKYSDNRIKKIESIQLNGEVTRLYSKGIYPPNSLLPNAWNQIGNQLAIEYFPSIGFEYEGRFKTADDSSKGNIFRGMFKIDLNLYPFSKLFKNKVQLFSNFHYRYDVINTSVINDRSHPSIETGANFIIYRKGSQKVAMGISYNNIDNPATGEEKQNFWLVAFKVKF